MTRAITILSAVLACGCAGSGAAIEARVAPAPMQAVPDAKPVAPIAAPPAIAADVPVAQAPAAGDGDATDRARAAFIDGADHVKKSEWAVALASFELSAKLRPHPITTYNIGACHRAIGQYLEAHLALVRAIEEDRAAGGGALPDALAENARAYLAQIDQVLVRVHVHVDPADASMQVDGRPLVADTASARPRYFAGIGEARPGARAPAQEIDLVLNPGAHVITLSREGFANVVVNRTFESGEAPSLDLAMGLLPATLHVTADRQGAIVHVGGDDVGPVPVDVRRPGGSYEITIQKKGFITYSTRVTLGAGERADIQGKLPERKPALTERWWFWTLAGAGVSAVSLGVYFAARPGPERPPVNGGGLGWVIDAR